MIQQFSEELNLYLQKKFNYKISLAKLGYSQTIVVNQKRVELYLRFKSEMYFWNNDTLVIARIAFEKQRTGNGKDLLIFLANLAQKYNYQKIGIEQANEKATSFAKKYRFQNLSDSHWIINVENLKQQFVLS